MSCQAQMIDKESYKDLKEYWDYQRLLEYNRELLKARLDQMKGSVFTQLGEVDTSEMYDRIWTNIKSEDLEKPPAAWIPENTDYRFKWEGEPDKTIKLPKPKSGRPVVLRAKHLQDEDNDI